MKPVWSRDAGKIKVEERPIQRDRDGFELCRFFLWGKCTYGDDCRYSHNTPPPPPVPPRLNDPTSYVSLPGLENRPVAYAEAAEADAKSSGGGRGGRGGRSGRGGGSSRGGGFGRGGFGGRVGSSGSGGSGGRAPPKQVAASTEDGESGDDDGGGWQPAHSDRRGAVGRRGGMAGAAPSPSRGGGSATIRAAAPIAQASVQPVNKFEFLMSGESEDGVSGIRRTAPTPKPAPTPAPTKSSGGSGGALFRGSAAVARQLKPATPAPAYALHQNKPATSAAGTAAAAADAQPQPSASASGGSGGGQSQPDHKSDPAPDRGSWKPNRGSWKFVSHKHISPLVSGKAPRSEARYVMCTTRDGMSN